MRIFTFLLSSTGFFILLLLNSCDTFNPENEIPAYIHIDKINLSTNTEQGTSSHKITDAWVYINDQQIGVFELPATFPVLNSGKQNIKIFAGVKMNGISATHISYPFYNNYIQDIDLKVKEIDTIIPSVSYYSALSFPFIENFEDAGIKIEKGLYSDTSLIQITNPAIVFEGNSCGGIFLDNVNTFYKGTSLSSSLLNLPNSPVFLELNYKNNQKFNIGIVGKYSTQDKESIILTLKPSDVWNKIYINLTEGISAFPNAMGYQLLITATKDADVSNPAIYIDNLKIVHSK